jgi:phosphoserine phosphatase
MQKAILIDLDGTLVNTLNKEFKPMKDGLETVDLERIKIVDGALNFIQKMRKEGNSLIIISDSHPKYVNQL